MERRLARIEASICACSSAVGTLSAILRRIESILARQHGNLLAELSQEMSATASTAWHREQRRRITAFQPSRPEMPGNYRCAPNCAEPIPLPNIPENFTVNSPVISVPTVIVLAGLVLAGGLLTFRALRSK